MQYLRLCSSLLSRYYALLLEIPNHGLNVSGTCEFNITGKFKAGKNLYLRSKDHHQIEITVAKGALLQIGDSVFINQGVRISATKQILIGNNVLIGDDVIILDYDYHGIGGAKPLPFPIDVQDNVWIASRAIILKGVTVGEGSVVAAGAVITKSVPPFSFVAGVPARVIRKISKQ